MQDSAFTKIIKGEIPCYKVYEDDKTLAFLDINPFTPGHVLVVPKVQIDHIDELPDEDYQAVYATVKNVSKRVKSVLEVPRAFVLVQGFDVPHAHVHVIPVHDGKEFTDAVSTHARPYGQPEPDHAALAEMAAKLAF